MQTLFDATTWLTYFPEQLDTRRSLWLVRDVLDVNAVQGNAVSLAIGCEPEDLQRCEPFLSAFPSVFLAMADEEIAEATAEMLAEYVPSVSILTPKKGVFGNHKSVREVMEAGGEKAVNRLLMGAIERNASGLLDIADVERADPMSIPVVLSGISALDRSIGGFAASELSVWTGKRGSGKSTLLGQMMLDAIEQGHNVCAYSGELSAWRFKQWTALQAAGRANVEMATDRFTGKSFYRVTNDAMPKIDDWWRQKFFLYDNRITSASDENSILGVFEYAARRYGCSVFLVDNLMTARFSTSAERDFFRAQSNFTGRLVEFAKKFEVHVHLVAHPRKSQGHLEADDVSGSGDITNRADNVFSLDRLDEKEAEKMGCDAALKVLKNRSFGETPHIGLCYDAATRRYHKPGEPEKHYAWEHLNREIVEIEDTINPFF